MASRATVAIISIGSMGLGIANLLQAYNYRIITNISDRSESTKKRASTASITLLPSDEDVIAEADYILSIVPPRDALALARRFIAAYPSASRTKSTPLYYLDLNAVSPHTAREIGALFHAHAPAIRFLDGGIIGTPPRLTTPEALPAHAWYRPRIPLAGPHPLAHAPVDGERLAEALKAEHIGAEIGKASGLKCCFASLTKGLTALALQSFGTAERLGVLPELQSQLREFSPKTAELASRGVEGCVDKAYRWVEEMREIGRCFGEEGGWADTGRVLGEVAGVYEVLSDAVEGRGGVAKVLEEGPGGVKGVVGLVEEGLEKRRGQTTNGEKH